MAERVPWTRVCTGDVVRTADGTVRTVVARPTTGEIAITHGDAVLTGRPTGEVDRIARSPAAQAVVALVSVGLKVEVDNERQG